MKNPIDAWRRNVCGQHYYISRLKTRAGWQDLRGIDAMFYPVTRKRAVVTMFKQTILDGYPEPGALNWEKIQAIEYVVSACAGKKVVTEDFRHPFKQPPLLTHEGDGIWHLETQIGNLFTTRLLNTMLSVNVFGSQIGAQFCC